ncbi:MAG: hypothetical protein KA757_14935 [Vogesella sp.]|jgi:hypothetical protein|nr:hypothetical protein [Vogesella sp.]
MWVQFIRGTALGGIGNDAAPGDVRELPDPQARAYLLAARAVQVAAPANTPADPAKPIKPKKVK